MEDHKPEQDEICPECRNPTNSHKLDCSGSWEATMHKGYEHIRPGTKIKFGPFTVKRRSNDFHASVDNSKHWGAGKTIYEALGGLIANLSTHGELKFYAQPYETNDKLPTTEQYVEQCKQNRRTEEDGAVDFDESPVISRSGDDEETGAYVMAWLWVDRSDIQPGYDDGDDTAIIDPAPACMPWGPAYHNDDKQT
jgi:hypothetical protein